MGPITLTLKLLTMQSQCGKTVSCFNGFFFLTKSKLSQTRGQVDPNYVFGLLNSAKSNFVT